MARKKHNSKRSSDKRVAVRPPLDLAKVNPHGRLDVLAMRTIERFTQLRAPQLLPILEKNKEVISAALNENLGPHAIGIDVPSLIDQLTSYAPLMMAVVRGALDNMKAQAAQAQGVKA